MASGDAPLITYARQKWYRLILLLFDRAYAHGSKVIQDATLSQGVPRDAAVNFGTYHTFQWHLRTRNSADSEIEDPHRTP